MTDRPGFARGIGKIASNSVDIDQRLSNRRMSLVRSEALQIVIEMRKIDERQRWIMVGHDHFGGFRNPTR